MRTIAFLTAVASVTVSANADALTQAAPDALVVVGESAPADERQSAERVAEHLRRHGGRSDNLVTDRQVNADLELAARHHLIVVGREESNRVLARVPSHWAMNRDWYYRDRAPFESYMPTTGYHAAGYGTFASGDVGYVEWDRNPYYHYASNIGVAPDQSAAKRVDLPYRQIVRITGNTTQGVGLAVEAAVGRSVLTGAVTADDRLPGPMGLWSLDTDHYALPWLAPAWVPTDHRREGERQLHFAGWHLADSMTYSGLEEATGKRARAIWRAKYLTERNWDVPPHVVTDPAHPMTRSPLFEATMARRASGNELFVARFASVTEATEAAAAVERALSAYKPSHAPWADARVGELNWRRSSFGLNVTTVGEFLVMESFQADHDALALNWIAELHGRGVK